MALTFVERERRDVRNDQLLIDLVSHRTRLAQLLASLLEVKRQREKQLINILEKELSKRFYKVDASNTNDSWLHEFQRLLSKEPFEVQVSEYGIDVRIGNILTELYNDLGSGLTLNNNNLRASNHFNTSGTMLQGKLVYYLGHFVDMTLDRLCICSPEDLLKLKIDDYELCQLISQRFKRLLDDNRSLRSHGDISSDKPFVLVSEENQRLLSINQTMSSDQTVRMENSFNNELAVDNNEFSLSSPSSEQKVKQQINSKLLLKDKVEEEKFWCEAECVICLDNKVCLFIVFNDEMFFFTFAPFLLETELIKFFLFL